MRQRFGDCYLVHRTKLAVSVDGDIAIAPTPVISPSLKRTIVFQ